MEIRQYQTVDGRVPFAEWLNALRDGNANRAIAARVLRMQAGNRGDWKPVGGVFELRIDAGPGCRVCCGQGGETLVLLLCAGDKRTQPNDIERAQDHWQDYRARRWRRF